jgi:hypothetical protein
VAPFRLDDLPALRSASLLLSAAAPPVERTPLAIATWFGAMQAQDLASGTWSFGARMPGSVEADVERAVVDRQILRTWPMRGTVHFVPAVDARWMLEVTGVRALADAGRRREFLGLTDEVVERAVRVLGEALAGGGCLTRAACLERLVDAGIDTAGQHGYHLLWYASQVGVTAMGPQAGKEQTFVLLDEWVPEPRRLDRSEALGELAVRYFRSHGPTTRQDFAGWTGLTQADAKAGIAAAGDALVTVEVEGASLVLSADLADRVAEVLDAHDPRELHLLPGFDELVLGFKDRSRIVPDAHRDAIVPGRNGVFMPTIVEGGRVVGTWKRTRRAQHLVIEPRPFGRWSKRAQAALRRRAEGYGEFVGMPVEVREPG